MFSFHPLSLRRRSSSSDLWSHKSSRLRPLLPSLMASSAPISSDLRKKEVDLPYPSRGRSSAPISSDLRKTVRMASSAPSISTSTARSVLWDVIRKKSRGQVPGISCAYRRNRGCCDFSSTRT